ncbi:FtsX-like permease family protein [Candidatus Poribacteria bacterium]|nr:FtsX-like permease family protein [Candidatus Poribacteria bacterium]
MRYEIFIALRYLKSRSGQFFLSFISLISVGGVAVGVATVIVALSVMNGWESMIRDKMLRSEGHIFIFGSGDRPISTYRTLMDKIENVEGVVATAPVLMRQAYLQNEDGSNQMGAMVKAINPELETQVTGISDYVSEDVDFESPLIELAQDRTEDTIFGGIILGKGVANRLQVGKGDIIRLVSRLVNIAGSLQPVIRTFVVIDIYDSGMYSYDNILAFVDLYIGQELYDVLDAVDRIEIKVDNIYKVDKIRKDIQMELGIFYPTMTWMEAHESLFSAIKLEKIVTFIIEALIIFVAAFNIASTLVMMVMDKTKEIGILKSMGSTKKSIWFIFTFEGTLIGVVGAILGTLLGVFLCWSLRTWIPIRIPNSIYQIDRLPAEVRWSFVGFVNLASLIICWLATIYPAWRASIMEPVESLRYE